MQTSVCTFSARSVVLVGRLSSIGASGSACSASSAAIFAATTALILDEGWTFRRVFKAHTGTYARHDTTNRSFMGDVFVFASVVFRTMAA